MDSEERISNLEIKISYLENTIEELNSKVIEQDEMILNLHNDILLLKSRMDSSGEDVRSEEKPPHY